MILKAPPSRLEIVLLFIMLVGFGGLVYQLYILNPVFMVKKSLSQDLAENKEHFIVFPRQMVSENSTTDFMPALPQLDDVQKSFKLNASFSTKRSYVREFSRPYIRGLEIESTIPWTSDGEYIYLSHQGALYKTDFDGNIQWSFHLKKEDELSAAPIVTPDSIFATTISGQIYRLKKEDGSLKWLLPLNRECLHEPVFYKNYFYLLSKEDSAFITKIDPKNGHVIWDRKLAGFTQPNPITINDSLRLILITDPVGSLLALDSQTGNAYWQKKELGTIVSSAFTKGKYAYISNKEALATALNLSAKKVAWEYSLRGSSSSNFSFLPEFKYLILLTDNGYLHAIDIINGEGKWHFKTLNKNTNAQALSVRLGSQAIQKFKLKWTYKGWTIWSPCADDRICIFNPEKGQIISRIKLRGKLASPPLFIGKDFFVSLDAPEKLPWSPKDTPVLKASLAKYKIYDPKQRKQSSPTEAADLSE